MEQKFVESDLTGNGTNGSKASTCTIKLEVSPPCVYMEETMENEGGFLGGEAKAQERRRGEDRSRQVFLQAAKVDVGVADSFRGC